MTDSDSEFVTVPVTVATCCSSQGKGSESESPAWRPSGARLSGLRVTVAGRPIPTGKLPERPYQSGDTPGELDCSRRAAGSKLEALLG